VPVTDRERRPRRMSFVWLCEEDMETWEGRQDALGGLYTSLIMGRSG